MLFDDNIVDVRYGERLGVVSVVCPNGLYIDDFQRGLDSYQIRSTGEMDPHELAEYLKARELLPTQSLQYTKPTRSNFFRKSRSRMKRKWRRFGI